MDGQFDGRLAKCGIVIIGHGNTATALLDAARQLIPGEGLADAIAIDAGAGKTPEFEARVVAAIEMVDEGRGILLIADLMGSSPCMCGMRESAGHGLAVVTGLNLAMLAKLATLDRRTSPRELADACADSVGRSICVKVRDGESKPPTSGPCS
ncbi:PTS sugar transporter subunit IIA [Nannocystaceae bacterium ST9]